MAKQLNQRSLFSTEEEPTEPAGPSAVEPVLDKEPSAGSPASSDDAPREDDLRGKSVYVIDSHSLIFQVFHAIPEMTSPTGGSVNAVYGFCRDLLYMIEQKQPDYLFAAFDLPGPTFRSTLFTDYKKDRGEVPQDLIPQFAVIERLLEALEIPLLSAENFEADDVLATVARLTEEAGGECFLVTGDKDCRQLITDHVAVYNIRKDQIYRAQELEKDWGIRPDQVVDFQSLVGDKVDNVPGVPLIGPKIAAELLSRFGTLDEILEHTDEVKGAKRSQNLREGREIALLSRQLVKLDNNVPIEVDWHHGRLGHFDRNTAGELFTELGFRSFAAQMLGGEDAPASESWEVDYQLVATPEALAELVEKLKQQELISIDTETTNVWPTWADLVGISCSFSPGEAFYLPLRSPPGDPQLDEQATLEALREVLEDPRIKKLGQNLKYDMIVLRRAGVRLAGVDFDTMIASYLLDAGQRNHNLDDLAQRYLNYNTTKISALIGTGKDQKRMDEVPVADVSPYACEDVDVPLRLLPLLDKELVARNLDELFRETELPLIDVLVEMESNGILVDTKRLAELSKEYGARLEKLEQEIYALAGRELNIASPKQLQQILFEELGLPVVKRTKTGPSTDGSVLEELAQHHPLPAKIIEFRQFAKLKNTYVDALPQMVHPQTGRVHASFNQVVAATGRLSCVDPNLQNIPVRNDRGREIRSAFRPRADWHLLAADYSQIELRVLAHFSGDEILLDAFANDEDIHTRVASEVYSVTPEEVTSEMRRGAKAVNFGVIYGQSPFGLAKQLGISQDGAAAFIDAYFEGYPGVEEFLANLLAECRATGYVKTILGRRRSIQGVRADAGRSRNLAERTAINTVIQGSAADLIKRAMIAVFHRLEAERMSAKMLLQIHDELVFEIPSEQLQATAQLVTDEMVGVMQLDVPLKVDVKSGLNWADLD